MATMNSPIFYKKGEVESLHDLFLERTQRTPQSIAYRHFDAQQNQWLDTTWLEMSARVSHFTNKLKTYGAVEGDRCVILLANSPDWVCADQTAFSLGMVTVPLFFNDRAENMAHVIKHAQARFLILHDQKQWDILQPLLEDSCLEHVILAGSFQVIWHQTPKLQAGKQVEVPHGLATIIYTSGTTGFPKGVMLSHKNILENAHACYHVAKILEDDLFLSFLPLSHAFERTVGYYLPMMAGATVAFARSVLSLQEDLPTIQPTVIITVPRMFEKVNERFTEKLSHASSLMQKLVGLAEDVGYQQFLWQQKQAKWKCRQLLFPLLDRLVGQKVRGSLGGRLRLAVSGGAPLSAVIAKRYLALGVPILQGYGLTECGPVVSSNSLAHNDPESVGAVLKGTELFVVKESGELLVRGLGVMMGYWQDARATAVAIDSSHWFHTGDIAKIEGHYLYITGRIKDILVLSNGEKVPPTDVEEAIAQDSWVDQVMVVGEGKAFLVAVIVPSKHGDADKQVWLKRLGKDMHAFPGYEKIKDIVLCDEPWTVEEGLLTPTMKLRRPQIMEKYASEIVDVFEAH